MAGKRIQTDKRRGSALTPLGTAVLLLCLVGITGGLLLWSGAVDVSWLHRETEPVVETPPEEMVPWAIRAPSVTAHDDELPDIHNFYTLVQEGQRVEDAYFADAVFLGDSRTEGFKLYSGLREGTYLFATGANVESIQTRKDWPPKRKQTTLLNQLATMKPGKIYVMLGVNELGWIKCQRFYDQFALAIDRIRADHPEATIVLQSIIPVAREQENKKTYINNGKIREYNQVVRQLAEEKQCRYLDVQEAVIDGEGYLRSELSLDGVHLNRDGCKLWHEYLATHPV